METNIEKINTEEIEITREEKIIINKKDLISIKESLEIELSEINKKLELFK
jgi:hypothetical protein